MDPGTQRAFRGPAEWLPSLRLPVAAPCPSSVKISGVCPHGVRSTVGSFTISGNLSRPAGLRPLTPGRVSEAVEGPPDPGTSLPRAGASVPGSRCLQLVAPSSNTQGPRSAAATYQPTGKQREAEIGLSGRTSTDQPPAHIGTHAENCSSPVEQRIPLSEHRVPDFLVLSHRHIPDSPRQYSNPYAQRRGAMCSSPPEPDPPISAHMR